MPQRSSQNSSRDISCERNVNIFPALIYSCEYTVSSHSLILSSFVFVATMLFPMIGMADNPPGSKNNDTSKKKMFCYVTSLLMSCMCLCAGDGEGDGEGHRLTAQIW